jgi:hypothetical protein
MFEGGCCRTLPFRGFEPDSGRKTGYLFVVWGGGQDTELMLCARHKTIKNALRYKRNAKFLLSLAWKNMTDLTLLTPKWSSLYCEQHQLAMELNREAWANFWPIYELAEIFAHNKLGVPRSNIVQHCRIFGEKLLSYSHESVILFKPTLPS